MASITRICVYCGSAGRVDEAYRAAAGRLGALLAQNGIELVYGGGRIGLMGLVADAAIAAGGRVIGIIPAHLHDAEIGHHGVSELVVVESMHQRKQRMFEMSDGFIVLPGGLGTLDETFEIVTWRQLGLHDKPIVIVDVAGYWRKLLDAIDHIVASGFAQPRIYRLFEVVADVEAALEALRASHEPMLAPETKLI